MLVGMGGNNGTTLVGGLLANKLKLKWQTKRGPLAADYLGSLSQAATFKLGDDSGTGRERYFRFRDVLPMVDPDALEVGGWDICGDDLAAAAEKACVLDYDLQRQLRPALREIRPLPGVYYEDFIASNQRQRVDNVLPGGRACTEHLQALRRDIRAFKEGKGLDCVVVVWTANTERFCDVRAGVHDSEENLVKAISEGNSEVAPSQIFAMASILEGCAFINGSPQNTFVPGVVEAARSRGAFIGGSDFKSGQTKLKSVLVDFLVGSGLRPESVVSYNHLGNNDGRNLSSPRQFRSKEDSKSRVVDDILRSNPALCGRGPDHTVVIKYVPAVGDSKRAMDEYVSRIFLGGRHTLALHNTCEDSLLAAPIILDLALFAELFSRVEYRAAECAPKESYQSPRAESYQPQAVGGRVPRKRKAGDAFEGVGKGKCEEITKGVKKGEDGRFVKMDCVLSALSFLMKAPVVPRGEPVVNALVRQRACLANFFRALLGLQPESDMFLEYKCPRGSEGARD